MTKLKARVFSKGVMFLNKILIIVFLLPFWLVSGEEDPSFIFSKEKGIQALTSEELKLRETNLPQKSDEPEPASSPASATAPPPAISPEESSTGSSEDSSEESPTPKNSISEDFAPQTTEKIQGSDLLDYLSENTSWFFQEKNTKHKIGFRPSFSYDDTYGHLLGLGLFSYSSDKKGYYFSTSVSKYLFRPYSQFKVYYIGSHKKTFRKESSFTYDNHYENYFQPGGLKEAKTSLTRLFAHRMRADYKVFYQIPNNKFYFGSGLQFFFRKERLKPQNNKRYFPNEFFFFISAFAGYDSRDNWKNPKEGDFHQFSFGCKTIFAYPGAYCRGEADLRFYISPLKKYALPPFLQKSTLALRALGGSSFFSPSTYSTAYTIGKESPFQSLTTLKSFKQNRFRGDKIYLAQTELRFPLWEEYLGAVLFTGLGSVAEHNKEFDGFVKDYGFGLHVGLPPNYNMKIRMDLGTGMDFYKKTSKHFTIYFLHAF